MADDHVRQGISPKNLFYSFPEVRRISKFERAKGAKMLREKAQPVRFYLSGKSAENYLSYFIDRWREVYHDEPPRSDLIWAFEDKRLHEYLESIAQPRFERHAKGAVPKAEPFEGAKVQFSEKANCYYTDTGGTRLWYSIDTDGDAGWHEKIRPDVDRSSDPIPQKRMLLRGNPRVEMIPSKGSSLGYRQQSKGE
jgi:hypothetical protein